MRIRTKLAILTTIIAATLVITTMAYSSAATPKTTMAAATAASSGSLAQAGSNETPDPALLTGPSTDEASTQVTVEEKIPQGLPQEVPVSGPMPEDTGWGMMGNGQVIISVPGHGKAVGEPDIITLQLGAVMRGHDPIRTMEEVTKATQAMTRAAKDAGIAPRDIRTSSFQIRENFVYDHETGRQNREDFTVTQQTYVTIRRLENAGTTIGALIQAVDHAGRADVVVQGVNAKLEDRSRLGLQALERATENMLEQAEIIAKVMDREVCKLLDVRAGGATPPTNIWESGDLMRMMAMEASLDMTAGAGILHQPGQRGGKPERVGLLHPDLQGYDRTAGRVQVEGRDAGPGDVEAGSAPSPNHRTTAGENRRPAPTASPADTPAWCSTTRSAGTASRASTPMTARAGPSSKWPSGKPPAAPAPAGAGMNPAGPVRRAGARCPPRRRGDQPLTGRC